MKYILDVNVLVAWGWADHADFPKVSRWISDARNKKSIQLITTPITQLGFVRISIQRSSHELSVSESCKILGEMIHYLGKQHLFLPDPIQSFNFPSWCKFANQTTDAHLFKLAESHQAKIATLDQKIPGAFLIQ